MDSLRHAAELIAGAERLVVFTGAGMSAESGVPTFRDALTGLWARYDAQTLATPEAFTRDPALVWGWYEWRRELVERVQPNPGHEAVARLNCTVITQNVDDLHERAGSPNPIHLHGSLFAPRCSACGRPAEPSPGPGNTGDDGPRTPPACGACREPVRPGVVWFGEALPQDALEQAVEAAANADVLITVGTAGVVHPAAEIPQVTAKLGGTVIQVNPQPTPLDGVCALNLRGTAAEVLPEIIR
ncbi:MAG: NAD-dependent deacylase [Actinomycetota bacterium]|nr:NAD-dependent deacylase [Actinomycetota bacterium]